MLLICCVCCFRFSRLVRE